MDRRVFFQTIRRTLFSGHLGKRQVAGIESILEAWARYGNQQPAGLAYGLATAHHETGQRMQPIRELGGNAYLTRLYDVTGNRPALARRNGNINPGDGVRFSGRGYVQLTWRANYRRIGRLLDVDLEAQPDLALQPELAARILIEGMLKGWFTGKRLTDYVNATIADFRDARRVVNGLDRAVSIARIATLYLDALTRANADTAPIVASLEPPPQEAIVSPKLPPQRAPLPRRKPATQKRVRQNQKPLVKPEEPPPLLDRTSADRGY